MEDYKNFYDNSFQMTFFIFLLEGKGLKMEINLLDEPFWRKT